VLGDPTLALMTELGFSFLINDDDGGTTGDGTGREGWLELTSGIGTGKDPYEFGTIRLVDTVIPGVDAGVSPGIDAGPMVGTDAAVPPGTDGGVTPGTDAGMTPLPADDGCGCRTAGGSGPAPLLPALLFGALFMTRRRRR